MLHSHCGKPVIRTKSFNLGRLEGEHEWQCQVCKRVFKQKIRLPGKAKFGWTVIRKDSAKQGFIVYKRDTPADAAHFAADLAPFTFPTHVEATRQGTLGNYAYKRNT